MFVTPTYRWCQWKLHNNEWIIVFAKHKCCVLPFMLGFEMNEKLSFEISCTNLLNTVNNNICVWYGSINTPIYKWVLFRPLKVDSKSNLGLTQDFERMVGLSGGAHLYAAGLPPAQESKYAYYNWIIMTGVLLHIIITQTANAFWFYCHSVPLSLTNKTTRRAFELWL